jgi:hypothetical protein
MAKIESNMAIMTSQFTDWMLEMRQLSSIRPASPEQGTKHSQEEYLEQLQLSQRAKAG